MGHAVMRARAAHGMGNRDARLSSFSPFRVIRAMGLGTQICDGSWGAGLLTQSTRQPRLETWHGGMIRDL
jgi:hypothetical protein